MNGASPYPEGSLELWDGITEGLLKAHPLAPSELAEVVLSCWDDIFETKIGARAFQIGKDIKPQPQIMGFLLHELIPLELQKRYPGKWRRQQTGKEKDLVYEPNPALSVEIKTSSHPSKVFGNRSYAQPTSSGDTGRKSRKEKSGYYLTINFDKFVRSSDKPVIRVVRFGWLDHLDLIAQTAATGQQARVRPEAYRHKLRTIFSK